MTHAVTPVPGDRALSRAGVGSGMRCGYVREVTVVESSPADRDFAGVTVLVGAQEGRYPSGNSLLLRGADQTVLVDPSLDVSARGGAPAPVDRVVLSHAHEDHVAGLHRFPDAEVLVHSGDLEAVRDLDRLLDSYGLDPDVADRFRGQLVEEFHVTGRADAQPLADGERLDLGGGRSATVVHLPGHTPGHSGLLVEPDGFFYVADVDLSAFGPYYGDAVSSLLDTERSLARCREVDARWYATFHHKGVIEGRSGFLTALDAYTEVIRRREGALLEFLGEPRSLHDVVTRRFVYRRHVDLPFADSVERHTAQRHLERLVADGRVAEVEPGRYQAVR